MVDLSKRGRTLLKRLCAGETLIEIRCRWSSWLIQERDGAARKGVIGWVAVELKTAGFVERVDDRGSIYSLGAFYEFYRYSVTDAGRAAVTATLAPKELT